MIIRDIEKPSDIILEARFILSERFKMFFSFLFFNMVGCLIVNFLDLVNKPYLWFCGLFLGCYLLYYFKSEQEYYQSATSLKFASVSELEKALNMKVDNDEWDTIKDLNQKNEIYLNVENVFFCFFLLNLFYGVCSCCSFYYR
ncbi:RipA family octameric membrane protein [Helicobacter pylori]|uniref:RipA family octameric membrane protein n=1 Tax=Helicobacter pylori TaxID=210 RepID=UPI0013CDE699|nr:hypothetical protein [Helicobacter pylori]